MVTIVLALALVLFGGGLYAIVDGWPYLVLERGFTQVIIGSVAATAGIILLALALVMRELRQMKASLSGALTAMTAASFLNQEIEPAPGDRSGAMAPVTPTGALTADRSTAPSSVPGEEAQPGRPFGAHLAAATGLAAGAGLAAAALQAPRAVEPASGPGAPVDDDTHSATHLHEDDVPAMLDAVSEPVRPADVEPAAAPMWDVAREGDVEPADRLSETDALAAAMAAAMNREPSRRRDTLDADDESETPSSLSAGHDSAPDHRLPEHVDASASDPADREAAWDREPRFDPLPDLDDLPDDRAVPSSPASSRFDPNSWRGTQDMTAREVEPREDAGAWMTPIFARRDAPPSEIDQELPLLSASRRISDEAAAIEWPSFDEPRTMEPSVASPIGAGSAERIGDDVDRDKASLLSDEASGSQEPTVPPAAGPAASAEGVIGAYQVGDTHFTMYADGSIAAKTPDGDYNFASMDELKTYLASEKSRLGE